MYSVIAFSLLLVIFANGQDLETFNITIQELGNIRGTIYATLETFTPYYQVQGIPYGKLDTSRRFRPSTLRTERLSGPDDFFDATTFREICVQSGMGFKTLGYDAMEKAIENSIGNSSTKEVSGSEECLNLNIYFKDTPTPDTELKPVIVFIHGGAFSSGSSNLYGAHRLLEHDVILVTINYRLGAFGFLYLGTEDAPGNAGLYDMVTALKWINRYIKYFGGDPDSVTITGQSAGGAAVTHLMASPLAKGLFHKAIAMSGSALNEWGTTTAAKAKAASLRVAEIMECYRPIVGMEPNLEDIAMCLNKETDLEKFVNALATYQEEERFLGRLGFDGTSPVIQSPAIPNIELFQTESPLEIFKHQKQHKVPFMTGATRHDGSYPLAVLYRSYLEPNEYLTNANYLRNDLLPDLLVALGIVDETNAVYDSIGRAYLREAKDSGNFTLMEPGLIDINSVFFFKASIYRTLELHSEIMPRNTFYYSFDYRSPDKSLFDLLFGFNPPPIHGGVTHADDLIYLFAIITLHDLSEEETRISKQMTQYWANFAKSGHPTLIGKAKANDMLWPAFGGSNKNYMIVDKDSAIGSNYPTSWEGAADELVQVPEITTTETPTSTGIPITTDDPSGTESPTTTPENDDDDGTTTESSSAKSTVTILWVSLVPIVMKLV